MRQTYLTFTKSKWQRFLYLLLAILGIFVLVGCGGVQTGQTPASEMPLLQTSTPTRETPQSTTSLSSTPTASQTPTWTPVPTLSVEIRKQNLIELFSTNGGCDFPCWWGIFPGDPIQKVAELSLTMGKSLRPDGSNYYYSLSLDELNAPDLDINYYVSNQVVQRIEIRLVGVSRFRDYYDAFDARLSLASLLNRHGKPSEVLFLVAPRFEPGEMPRPYTLFLIYDKQDFGIVYSGLVDYDDPLRVCSVKLDDHRFQYMTLYMKNPRLKIAEINRFNSAELVPLEQVASISLEDFYRAFSAPENSECIEINTDPWQ